MFFYLSFWEQLPKVSGKEDTKGCLQREWGCIILPLSFVALNVTVTEATCSNVTISWTLEDNRTVDFLIFYRSSVHERILSYTSPDASPSYTTKLTNLVADTEYTITVVAEYSDNNVTSAHVTTNTNSGTPSEKGTYVCTTVN